jgi:Transglycosylase-like domain
LSRRQRRDRRRRRQVVRTLGAAAVTAALGVGAFAGIAAGGDEPTERSAVRRAPVVVETALVAASEKVEARLAVQQLARAVLDRAVIERAAAEKAEQESLWDSIAACETQGDWSMQGSSFSGGLGFANSAWSAFGGHEFAPNAGRATREEQIVVAERIRAAVGMQAWGCAKRVGVTGR